MEHEFRYANWSNDDILKCCRQVYLENAHEMTKYSRQSLIIISSSISSVWFVFVLATLFLYIKWRKEKIMLVEIKQFFNHGADLYEEPDHSNYDPKRHEFKEEIIREDILSSWDDRFTFHKGMLLSGQTVLIKKAKSSGLRSALISEAKCLLYAGEHPNIQKIYGTRTDTSSQGDFWLFLEFYENRTLSEFLKKMKSTSTDQIFLNPDQIYLDLDQTDQIDLNTDVDVRALNQFALQIASGMEFISSRKMIHGDLRADAVYLTENNICKIGDFSLSRRLYSSSEYVKTSHEPLPWRWMSPESLKLMTFSEKSDVWSYGVTLWEIFSFGAQPYLGFSWDVDFPNKLEAGLRLTKPEEASTELFKIMNKCWESDANSRPTFKDLTEMLFYYKDGFENMIVYTYCY